jgi:hypothetical protein
LLALAAAAALGQLAAALLGRFLWPAFDDSPRWQRILLGGLAAGVALGLLAAGSAAAGTQLLLLIVLPPLGFAVAALRSGRWVAVALVAAGPLAFADPEELTVLLGFHDVGFWALVAAAISAGLALAALAVTWPRVPGRLAGALAAVVVAASGGLYVAEGHPGFYGDRLFVILKAEPGLSGLPTALPARRAEVYRRLVATAKRSQAPVREALGSKGIRFTSYYLVNAVEADDSPELRALLAGRDDVSRVLPSPRLRPIPDPGDPLTGSARGPSTWNLDAIGAGRAHDRGIDGSGIVIGESDSGVDGAHPALRGTYRGGGRSWLDPWNHSRRPVDVGGHGTHTTAIAMSVAPGAQWIGCVNLARNLGNPGAYVTCLQFMLAPYPDGGDPLADGDTARAADVLNNSWGCPDIEGCDTGSLRPAFGALRAAGIFAVVAAGNSGPRCGSLIDPPALYRSAFTVGATSRSGAVADFSSRSAESGKPDLVAPGAEVVSALPGGAYGAESGTSMAAPHVTGVVALMWSANPDLRGDVDATADILRRTARRTPDPGCSAAGAGLVDADAAVLAARGRPSS